MLVAMRVLKVLAYLYASTGIKCLVQAQRQRQREDAIVDADQAAKKLVSRLLQKQVLNLAINPTSKPAKSGSSSRTTTSEPDIFNLPPLPEHLSSALYVLFAVLLESRSMSVYFGNVNGI